MINWHEHVTLPAMRTETHFDGRTLSCFADRPASFYAMFAQAVASAPEHEALSCNGERWTYAQVEREVTRIAAGLSMRGIVAGERVLMFISNKPEFVFMLYALQKIGAIAVPVGTREQGPGLTYILNQCGAAGVVFDSELADRIPAADAVPALRLRITIDAHINLIPLNPTGGFTGVESTTGHQFQSILQAAGFPCTFRQRRGIDVAAGCGMLKAEKRLKHA
jgi:O-succinylbenzoic acid--CoA ligase